MSAELIESKTEATDKPKIYIACLAAYNSGHLHGKWVEPADTVEGLQEQINQVLKSSPVKNAEEWAIHDYDGFYNLGENPDLKDIVKLAEVYNAGGQDKIDDFLEYYQIEDLDSLEDSYQGHYQDFSEFAQEMAEMCIEGFNDNSTLARYFDFESWERDLSYEYNIGSHGHVWGSW